MKKCTGKKMTTIEISTKVISQVTEQVWHQDFPLALELEESIRSLPLREKIGQLLRHRNRKLFCEYFLGPYTDFILECFGEPMSTEKIYNFNKYLMENVSVSSSSFILALILLAKIKWRQFNHLCHENRDAQFLLYISCVMTAVSMLEDLTISNSEWLMVINSCSGFKQYTLEDLALSQVECLKYLNYSVYVSSKDFHKFLDIMLDGSEIDFTKIFEIFSNPSRPDFEL